jgi:hypothetical protein
MIHDNDKEACLLMDTENAGNRNMIKKEAQSFKNTMRLNLDYGLRRVVIRDNKGNWNHLKIVQKISEKYKWKEQH